MDVSINKNDKDGLKHQLEGWCNVIETCSRRQYGVQSDARTKALFQFNRWIISGEIAQEIQKFLSVGYADRDSVEQVSAWLAAHSKNCNIK